MTIVCFPQGVWDWGDSDSKDLEYVYSCWVLIDGPFVNDGGWGALLVDASLKCSFTERQGSSQGKDWNFFFFLRQFKLRK